MDGEAGWWTTSGNIGLPPLARAMGVGRQQQQQDTNHTSTTHFAALKRYFPDSLVAPMSNSEQINYTFSNHTYTKSTPNHIHHHYAPFVTLTYHNRHHLFTCTHIRTHGFMDIPYRSEGTAGQMDGGRWLVDHKREDRTPSLTRVEGVDRQHKTR